MTDLTMKDISAIDKMFDTMDIDHDGEISIKELIEGLAKAGIEDISSVEDMFKDADADGNGKIEWDEFLVFTNAMSSGKKHVSKKTEKVKRGSNLNNEKRREILRMFHAMDPNGNGFVDYDEFEKYITNNNVALSIQRIRQLYEIIRDSDKTLDAKTERKGITITDLISYYELEAVQEKNMPEVKVDPGALKSIKDIEDYISASNLTGANVCNNTVNIMATGLDNMEKQDSMRNEMDQLVSKTSALAVSISEAEKTRWKPFASFKRRVDRKTVMASPSGILKDLLPGQYDTGSLLYHDDLPPIEPEKTVVRGVRWEEGEYEEDGNGKKTWIRPSRLNFPNTFDEEIATDIATTETLKYYGAMIIESTQQKVELDVRQVLQDFDYKDDYLEKWVKNPEGANGAALEHHGFAHLDCPLGPMKDSGYFVLAKFTDDAKTTLAITGFQVPTRHTVLTPKDVLHTNNYLRGVWRTMLADGFINEGKLFKAGSPITFSFKS